MFNPIIGIDVSKFKSDICVLSPSNKVIKRMQITNDYEGMNIALSYFLSIEKKYDNRPVIILEATSHYHQLLTNFYQKHNFEVIVINPIQSRAIKNLNIRKIKSDKTDAYNIALLYRLKNFPSSESYSDLIESIKQLCRQHENISNEIVEHTNRLTGYLDISFPGFRKIFTKIKGKTTLKFLQTIPDIGTFLTTDKDKVLQLIQKASHKSYSYAVQKYNALYEIAEAQKEIYICKMSTGILIETTATIILTLTEAMKKIDEEICNIIKSNSEFSSQISLLKSIPGVADYTAATLLSEIGNIKKFKRGKELVAFFGMDPSISQSGTYNKKDNKISKRGSPHVRKVLHTLAKNNVFNTCNGKCRNPILQNYYESKIQNKPYKVVMCSVMRKLINIIFAVLRDQKPFEFRTPEEHEQLIRIKCKKAA